MKTVPVMKRRDLLAITAMLAAATSLRSAEAGQVSDAAIERSQLSPGDPARFKRVFARAERGETIRLGFIGGSITAGAIATAPANSYAARVSDWWRKTFPKARIETVNAAVGGTGSLYGSLRVGQDFLSRDLDAVIIEFSVNDAWTDQEPFESLVRHVLASSPDIAVMLLFMVYDQGGNEQDWQQKIGAHYKLPMVSYRDAVWPELQSGRMKAADIFVDIVHPNDAGHRITADLVTTQLDRLRKAQAGDASDADLPPPLYGDRFQNARWIGASKLKPKSSNGWTLTRTDDPPPHSLGPDIWLSEPGVETTLSLAWEGTGLVVVMMLDNGDTNPVTLEIDGKPAQVITTETQPRRNVVTVALDLPKGAHSFSISRKLGIDARPPFGLYGIGIVP